MTYNKNTQTSSLWTKAVSLLTVFVLSVVSALAVPGITATNLQTTAGVNVTSLGSTLNITAPDKAVLTWQNFGSGADAINVGDVLNYVLPSKNSAVLNVVSGNAATTIDGSIVSNGNVFVLNPNGVLIGSGAKVDVNSFHVSTSDNPAFASFYFQQNGKLPSQDGLVRASGNVGVQTGAIINVTENISITAQNVSIGGIFVQGNMIISADGNASLGSAGLSYINGELSISNPTGTTSLGSAGNSFIVTGNTTVDGGSTSTFTTNGAASTLQTKSLTVVGGTINSDRVNTNNLKVTGNNITVAIGSGTLNPSVNAIGNGAVNISAPSALTANVTNTAAIGTTSVSAVGPLALGKVSVSGDGTSTFTGSSIFDTSDRIFVYGNTAFNATTGNVTLNKASHSFGPLSVSAPSGEVLVFEDAATQLNVVNTPKLTLRSSDYVFQTATTGVINATNTSVTAVGNVTLNAVNNSTGTYTITGKDIALVNTGAASVLLNGGNVTVTSTGPVTLNNVVTSGTLGVTSTGAITQAVDTQVNSVGSTSFVSTGITLTNTGNTFGGLIVDVGLAGNAAINEDTTLNLVFLKADTATLRSNENVITTGILLVSANTFNVVAGMDFIPSANLRAVNTATILAGNTADLSLLGLATNLNGKTPTVLAKSYKAPQL